MYFLGSNTFSEPWHLPHSPSEQVAEIVYASSLWCNLNIIVEVTNPWGSIMGDNFNLFTHEWVDSEFLFLFLFFNFWPISNA